MLTGEGFGCGVGLRYQSRRPLVLSASQDFVVRSCCSIVMHCMLSIRLLIRDDSWHRHSQDYEVRDLSVANQQSENMVPELVLSSCGLEVVGRFMEQDEVGEPSCSACHADGPMSGGACIA